LSFKQSADQSLGIRLNDELKLIPLSELLESLEKLHAKEISDSIASAELSEQIDHSFQEIEEAIQAFWERIRKLAELPDSKSHLFECVPLDDAIFDTDPRSDFHRHFLDTYKQHYRFNERRGKGLFEFMLAHYMQQNRDFQDFGRGLRSKILGYSGSIESLYSIWEGNKFGRLWTLPRNELPTNAYASASYRLIEALFSIDFETAYKVFVDYLNPLRRFPVQFLYNLITHDPKTLLQDLAQSSALKTLPTYDVQRTGGEDHAPHFACVLAFRNKKFEASGNSKFAAERDAAHKAIEYLLTTERRKISRHIAGMIAAGMQKGNRATKILSVPVNKLTLLRKAVGTACDDAAVAKCLTLRADIKSSSQSTAANEEFAFCGSWLAQAFLGEVSGNRPHGPMLLRAPILLCIKQTRSSIFSNTWKQLNEEHYFDIIQALLYAEFLRGGYSAAREVFDKCVSIALRDEASITKAFQANVPYTTVLQEYVQQFGVHLPEYIYRQVEFNRKTNTPRFLCQATYREFVGEGTASTKRVARQKAAFSLLKKMHPQALDT
jgi:dsRNA-specific ribonuclease